MGGDTPGGISIPSPPLAEKEAVFLDVICPFRLMPSEIIPMRRGNKNLSLEVLYYTQDVFLAILEYHR